MLAQPFPALATMHGQEYPQLVLWKNSQSLQIQQKKVFNNNGLDI